MLVSGLLMAVSSALAAIFAMMLAARYANDLALVSRRGGRLRAGVPASVGGGVAIVLGGSIAGMVVAAQSPWPAALFTGLGVLVAGVGLADDAYGLPPLVAPLTHVATLALAIGFGLPFDLLPLLFGVPLWVPLLAAIVVLAGVYWIAVLGSTGQADGLALTEALFVVTAMAGLAASSGQGVFTQPYLWWLIGLVAALAVPLVSSWPAMQPGLGRTGTGYIGFMTGILALATMVLQWLTVWEWLILVAVMVADGTVGRLRVLLAQARGVAARPDYAHQALCRRLGSRRRLLLGVFAVNLFWLYPLALYVHHRPEWGPLTTLIAYLPLFALAWLIGAGRPGRTLR